MPALVMLGSHAKTKHAFSQQIQTDGMTCTRRSELQQLGTIRVLPTTELLASPVATSIGNAQTRRKDPLRLHSSDSSSCKQGIPMLFLVGLRGIVRTSN